MAICTFYMTKELKRLRPAEDEAAAAKTKQARDVAHQAAQREQEKIADDAQQKIDRRERYRVTLARLITEGEKDGERGAKALVLFCRGQGRTDEEMISDVDRVERGLPLPEEVT